MLTRMTQLWNLGAGWPLAASILLALVLLLFVYAAGRLAWIDAKTRLLPDRFMLPWAAVSGVLLLAACVCAGNLPIDFGWVAYAPSANEVFSPGGFTSHGAPGSAEWLHSLFEQRADLAAPLWGVWGLRVVAGGVLAWLFHFLLRAVSPPSLGFGDVKLAGVLGMHLGYVGWWPLLLGTLLAFTLAGLTALVLVLVRRVGWRDSIPFGPFMIAGAAVALALPA
ncbi:leader peptidase (prepilin peptidase)/N-methyltransferase [Arthrobacter woluwensis]|uniref:prepilin peptidase n=1 Tax=Arthrobacter woluwensis TaxID=156980 RepID=UPI002788BF75|nr:A24 family peptidase [Arthrobacter woluwensis]MDQ0707982.1 leader peptidase (prepilin peptidase)/N-methyltransferase [Arthrobacter woluwensis]